MAQLSHGVHTYFMTISGCKSGCLNLSTSTLPCVFPPPISSPRAQIKGRLDLLAPCTSYFWTWRWGATAGGADQLHPVLQEAPTSICLCLPASPLSAGGWNMSMRRSTCNRLSLLSILPYMWIQFWFLKFTCRFLLLPHLTVITVVSISFPFFLIISMLIQLKPSHPQQCCGWKPFWLKGARTLQLW